MVRFLGALPVLRWPLAGAVIAIIVDLSDLIFMNYLDLGGGGLPNYQAFDKAADLPYLVTFLVVALRWRGIERRLAVSLFALRMIGIAAFEVTGSRTMLFAFPNAFEFWFLFVVVRDHYAAGHDLSRRRTAVVLGALCVAKWGQEYLLHRHDVVGVRTDGRCEYEVIRFARRHAYHFRRDIGAHGTSTHERQRALSLSTRQPPLEVTAFERALQFRENVIRRDEIECLITPRQEQLARNPLAANESRRQNVGVENG